jgi:hypothetical protein
MFGTALNYCVLRILGVPAEHPVMARARTFIQENGGSRRHPGPLPPPLEFTLVFFSSFFPLENR